MLGLSIPARVGRWEDARARTPPSPRGHCAPRAPSTFHRTMAEPSAVLSFASRQRAQGLAEAFERQLGACSSQLAEQAVAVAVLRDELRAAELDVKPLAERLSSHAAHGSHL